MQYCAVIPHGGRVRHIYFDAADEQDAQAVALRCNAGLTGPAPRPEPEQVVYNLREARQILGGVSRGTIYNWLASGRLQRLPDTRRVLITRQSIERAFAA